MNVPKHIGIIMDGNGRWAKKRFLTKKAGHKAGADALNKLAEYAEEIGIEYLTVYAFSTENWKREPEEVNDLMKLLRDYINQYIRDTKKNNMKINVIGELSKLSDDLQKDILYLEDLTKNKKGLNTIIAINYGGRDEITRASKKIVEHVLKTNMDINLIDENFFGEFLDTKDFPDPELIIRTSGELRISNFLLWQSAYSEFYFSDKLWPDFNNKDLLGAIENYNDRKRNFGGR